MTQYEQVLKHLEEGKSINPYYATLRYGITRLGAVIFELRRDGYPIKTTMIYKKKKSGGTSHYAEYSLEREDNDNA